MNYLMNHPPLIFVISFGILYLSAQLGVWARQRTPGVNEGIQQDLGVVLAATLTLLGLIIGFSFSMATSRYDLRKHAEEEEANAIGTEYTFVDLLPADDAKKAKALLTDYLQNRVQFYDVSDEHELEKIDDETGLLQSQLWDIIKSHAEAERTPVAAVMMSGMDKVSSAQAHTQAAWLNRIPTAAWGFMWAIAIMANVMMGFSARRAQSETLLVPALPLILAVCFFFLADIENPRGGLIHVRPQNLMHLSQSLRKPH
jgi:hypothetical protein